MRKVIDDEAVQISLREEASWEASPITPVDSPEYAALAHTVRQVFPDTLVAPFLMVGATDSRHFSFDQQYFPLQAPPSLTTS
jgi:carboxypeptidase PM20D1